MLGAAVVHDMGSRYLYLILLSVSLLVGVVGRWPDNKLHVWFFNVGQGDGVLIKTPQNQQILIDGGPDATIVSKLGKTLPFWDRSIDVIMVSHPHADHINGLIEVLLHYQVGLVVIDPWVYGSSEYNNLLELIEKKNVPKRTFFAGESFSVGGVEFKALWPKNPKQLQVPNQEVNDLSSIVQLKFGHLDILFTGDAEIGNPEIEVGQLALGPVDIVKVPHQGSKDALSEASLKMLRPSLAVISVAEKNQFGHPSSQVTDLLNLGSIRTKLTYKSKDVQVVSTNGDSYTVISN